MTMDFIFKMMAPAKRWVGRPAKHACEGGGLPRDRKSAGRRNKSLGTHIFVASPSHEEFIVRAPLGGEAPRVTVLPARLLAGLVRGPVARPLWEPGVAPIPR